MARYKFYIVLYIVLYSLTSELISICEALPKSCVSFNLALAYELAVLFSVFCDSYPCYQHNSN